MDMAHRVPQHTPDVDFCSAPDAVSLPAQIKRVVCLSVNISRGISSHWDLSEDRIIPPNT